MMSTTNTWQGVLGHDELVQRFSQSLARGRLASSYLFVGPAGIGKQTFAVTLAHALLCLRPRAGLAPCGDCDSCRQFHGGEHPDLIVVEKPQDRSVLPIALLIGSEERRMREGLCHAIGLTPFCGGRKVAIIDDADTLGIEGANCLLKTLEEPPPRSLLILIATSLHRQLPTVRSRCQILRFRPLAQRHVARLLIEQGLVDDEKEAARLAQYAGGSLQRARRLVDPELWEQRTKLLSTLVSPRPDGVAAAGEFAAFVDRAGAGAADRRARAREALGMVVDFYRQLLRRLLGDPLPDDPEIAAWIERAVSDGHLSIDATIACVERTLDALGHVDRNANKSNWIDGWFDDLAEIVATGQPI